MPILTDPRAEAFAVARARGANLEDAYELAGFAGGQGHASRFAARPKVAARIGELIEAGRRQPITGQDIAFDLQRIVRHFAEFDTPERMRETRETLLELRKMQIELDRERATARRTSPNTAWTSPKPPVSARFSARADRTALTASVKPVARIAASPAPTGAASQA